MHIPDGYLDLWIAAVCYVIAALVIGVALRQMNNELDDTRVALLGVISAGIFAAQMLNWPIPGGTSAHFVGGALAAILLGPYLGVLSVTSVLAIQTFMFGDGGITALGANILNMAIIPAFVGYALFRLLRPYNRSVATFAAGWLGITAGAIAAGIELGLSSTFNYQLVTVLAAMGVSHFLLGLIEGVITMIVYRHIVSTRPDILVSGLKPSADQEGTVEASG